LLRLEPIIEGNPRAPTLFFVQGWPDDRTLWDEQVALLSPHHRCVRVDLPNYGRGPRVRRGYRTEEIVERTQREAQSYELEYAKAMIATALREHAKSLIDAAIERRLDQEEEEAILLLLSHYH